jgi:hypothetical protein
LYHLDTFSVEDMLSIRSVGQNKIAVEISFEVKFIKSTWFKIMIESNTNSEMTKWVGQFFKTMKENVDIFSKNKSSSLNNKVINKINSNSAPSTPAKEVIVSSTNNVSGICKVCQDRAIIESKKSKFTVIIIYILKFDLFNILLFIRYYLIH